MKAIIQLSFTAIFLIIANYAKAQSEPVFPKVGGYVGIVHPIVSFSSDGTHTNFSDFYLVGMSTGINIWKSSKVGFSVEIVTYVKAENGLTKMNNLLFHPGVLVGLGKGFTFAGRAAFETSGRFGFTPVLNKVVKRNKSSNFFLALPLPVRFGNDLPTSFSVGFQFGMGF